MRHWWLAMALLAAPAVAQDAGVGDVYGTALGNGWENWSWAKVELSSEVQGSQRKPIRVEAGPYQALYLHHAPFDTTAYKSVAMLIQGMDGGAQQLRIVAVVGGKPLDTQAYTVTLPASGWKKIELPLSRIGADNKQIDGLWVQNATDKPVAPFYVTEITLH
ncbi:hypothetical protein ASE73_04345 [Sphingomonas sp. Leaf24]|uniref:hypothetical protein n=1 Tax=unclassified Sphingomonas TaxID=196159 RepID=UPI0006F5F71B|nr:MULTISPECIES: hypothetical protein [unclassified Sphingomonas]KQM19989.1 hypothetical protein ASE50_03980 [Sphingomonas sp. Leaf5]KQM90767.1 hypothetical protein ASE73_04345 [Sphingomonas sp. Leaf24]